MDFNITNRVDFEDQYLTRALSAHFSCETSFQFQIRSDQAFFVKKLKWKPVIVPMPQEPPEALWVTIKDRKTCDGDVSFHPPVKMLASDKVSIQIVGSGRQIGQHRRSSSQNPDPHIPMTFQIWGTLFTYKPNAQITDKELIGISLLNKNESGLAILQEEAVNGLNDYLISVGGPDLRALPFSLGSLQALPEAFQNAICSLMFNPKQTKALFARNKEIKAISVDESRQFAADAARGTPVDKLDTDYLQQLAKHMLVLGWKKGSDDAKSDGP